MLLKKIINETLGKLESAELIQIYYVEDKPFLNLISWAKHQTIRNLKSKYPSPDDADCVDNKSIEINCKQSQANVSVIQSNPNPNHICAIADKPQKPAPKKFVPPTIEEVQEYCKKRNKGIDAETFWHYYNSNGWMRNKTSIKDWKSAVITWERNSFDKKTQTNDGYNANWVELPKERA